MTHKSVYKNSKIVGICSCFSYWEIKVVSVRSADFNTSKNKNMIRKKRGEMNYSYYVTFSGKTKSYILNYLLNQWKEDRNYVTVFIVPWIYNSLGAQKMQKIKIKNNF